MVKNKRVSLVTNNRPRSCGHVLFLLVITISSIVAMMVMVVPLMSGGYGMIPSLLRGNRGHDHGTSTTKHSTTTSTHVEFILTMMEPKKRKQNLHLIGERHSGTRWVYNHLSECFNKSVTVSEKLARWKHWFQYEIDFDVAEDTYVIAMFQNPYEWVERMRRVPHHSPLHKNLEWKEFVTTPWTMPRFGRDLRIANHTPSSRADRICEQGFYYDQVVPCLDDSPVGEMHPLYEHNPVSGRPYKSILDLRRDKILNFVSIEHYDGVAFFDAWKYEDVVEQGSAQLVKQLEEVMGVTATCQSRETEEWKRIQLDLDYVKWMQEHVDWDNSEAVIGYHVSDY